MEPTNELELAGDAAANAHRFWFIVDDFVVLELVVDRSDGVAEVLEQFCTVPANLVWIWLLARTLDKSSRSDKPLVTSEILERTGTCSQTGNSS